jgi:Flp pilus assembly protein TadD
VFIAICTKKDQVLTTEDAVWKTSDWIIQEIGFAMGRGCKLIILLEEGVREPGSLQGDLEYIKFERASPAKCSTKLLQMINNIVPHVKTHAPPQGVAVSLPVKHRESTESVDWKTPSESWSLRQYEFAFSTARLYKEDQIAVSISESFLANSLFSPNQKVVWQAFCDYTHIVFGANGSVAQLTRLSISHPENSDILKYLAMALGYFNQYIESAQKYEIAGEKAEDPRDKLYLMGKAAVQYVRAGERESDTGRLLESIKSIGTEKPIFEKETISVLREIFNELDEDGYMSIATMQRLVELDPSDANVRFALAHAHADRGNKELALYHYTLISIGDRGSGVWNNLGVVYDSLELKSHSVDAYRRAEELGETLAMSNLALKFIAEGFIGEAKKLCDTAIDMPKYHNNVLTTASEANIVFANEEKRIEEICKAVARENIFYAKCGRGLAQSISAPLSGKWVGDDCVLDIDVNGSEIRATGNYTKEGNQLGGGLGGLGGLVGVLPGSPSSMVVYKEKWLVEYKGKIQGRTVDAHVTRNLIGGSSTLLGSIANTIPVLLVLSDDQNEFEVMENQAIWYKLKRVPVT